MCCLLRPLSLPNLIRSFLSCYFLDYSFIHARKWLAIATNWEVWDSNPEKYLEISASLAHHKELRHKMSTMILKWPWEVQTARCLATDRLTSCAKAMEVSRSLHFMQLYWVLSLERKMLCFIILLPISFSSFSLFFSWFYRIFLVVCLSSWPYSLSFLFSFFSSIVLLFFLSFFLSLSLLFFFFRLPLLRVSICFS